MSTRREREERREELETIRKGTQRKEPTRKERERREEFEAVREKSGPPEVLEREAQEDIKRAEETLKQAESLKQAYGSIVTWGAETYDLGTTQGWKAYNQTLRERKSEIQAAKRGLREYKFAAITSQAPKPRTDTLLPYTAKEIRETGPPRTASAADIRRLQAEGYELPEDRTIYISPGGEVYYYENEPMDSPVALSRRLWTEAMATPVTETRRFLGVPYSVKGVKQIGAVLAGAAERATTPVTGLIPGEQPLEVMPGEDSFSWRDLKAAEELSDLEKRVAAATGITAEAALRGAMAYGGGVVGGKAAGAAGSMVSRVPMVGEKASAAAKYLLKPRFVTTAAVYGGVAAAEGGKVVEMVRRGDPLIQMAAEVGLDIAEMYAFDVGFAKGLGGQPFIKTSRETLPVKRGKVSVPLEEGGAVDWQGWYLSKGDDAAILTGKVKVPDVPDMDDILIAPGYVPETSIDSEVTLKAMRRMRYDPTDITNIEDIRSIVGKTKGVKSQFIDDILPTWTGTLDEAGVKAVKSHVLKHLDDVDMVYGSYAVKPQLDDTVEYILGEGGKTISALRTPGDIDIQLLTSGDEATKFADDLVKELRAIGETVRIDPYNPLLIEAKVGPNKWAHAVDIHAAGDMTDTIPMTKAWGFSMDKPPVMIESVPSMSAAEQGIRKASSIMGFKEVKTIGPKEHRMKDIPDFFQVQDTLISSIPSPLGRARTRTQLETLLGRYGGVEKIAAMAGPRDVDDVVSYVFKPEKPSYPAASPAAYATPSLIHPSVGRELKRIESEMRRVSQSVSRPSGSFTVPSYTAASLPSLPSIPSVTVTLSPSRERPSHPITGMPSAGRRITEKPSPWLPSPKITMPEPDIPSPWFPSPDFPSPDYPSPSYPSPEYPSPSPDYPSPSYPSTVYPSSIVEPTRKRKKKGRKKRRAAAERRLAPLKITFPTVKVPEIEAPEFKVKVPKI